MAATSTGVTPKKPAVHAHSNAKAKGPPSAYAKVNKRGKATGFYYGRPQFEIQSIDYRTNQILVRRSLTHIEGSRKFQKDWRGLKKGQQRRARARGYSTAWATGNSYLAQRAMLRSVGRSAQRNQRRRQRRDSRGRFA